jgi:hypothetical protein
VSITVVIDAFHTPYFVRVCLTAAPTAQTIFSFETALTCARLRSVDSVAIDRRPTLNRTPRIWSSNSSPMPFGEAIATVSPPLLPLSRRTAPPPWRRVCRLQPSAQQHFILISPATMVNLFFSWILLPRRLSTARSELLPLRRRVTFVFQCCCSCSRSVRRLLTRGYELLILYLELRRWPVIIKL